MGPALPNHSLQLQGGFDHLLDRLLLRHALQLGNLLERVRQLRPRHLRDQVGDPRGLPETHSPDPAHVPHRHFRPHRSEGDDLRHRPLPILVAHVGNHLFPAVRAEIHVNVRRRNTLGVEEPLKQKAVPERAQVGDAQHVGDQAARRAAPAGPNRDSLPLGVVDEVPDDQEVTDESGFFDHPHLEFQALLQFPVGPRPVAIPLPQPLLAKLPEVLLPRHPRRHGKSREFVAPQIQLQIAPLRDRRGVFQGIRESGKKALHLRGRFEVELRPVGLHLPVRVVDPAVRGNADKNLLGDGVFLADIVDVVGRHQRGLCLLAQAPVKLPHFFLLRQAVIMDLQEEIFRPENLPVLAQDPFRVRLPPLQEGGGHLAPEAGARPDQPRRMRREQLVVDSRLVINTLKVRRRHQTDQVPVAFGISRQQEKVVVRVLSAGG